MMIEVAGERDGDATEIGMTPRDCRCSILISYVDTCVMKITESFRLLEADSHDKQDFR